MPDFILELSGYYTTGWIAILEKVMIFSMVFWILWCVKLYYEADDGLEPILKNSSDEYEE